MQRTAHHPYLRYATLRALRCDGAEGSVPKWLYLENVSSALRSSGREVSKTFTTICSRSHDGACQHGLMRPRAARSSSLTTGPNASRSVMPNCASSKAVFERSWTRCSVSCLELRSLAP